MFAKNYKTSNKNAFIWEGYLPLSQSNAKYLIDILPIISPENKYQENSLRRAFYQCEKKFNLIYIPTTLDRYVGNRLIKYPPNCQISIRGKYHDLSVKYIFFALISLKKFNCTNRECVYILGNWLLFNMERYKTPYLLTPTFDNTEWYYWLIISRMKDLI